MSNKDIDIEFLYWAFKNFIPNVTGEPGTIGLEKWDTSKDPRFSTKGYGIVNYLDFYKQITNLGLGTDAKSYKLIKELYEKILENRGVNPNTPGEIRLQELVEFSERKGSDYSKVREKVHQQVETFKENVESSKKIYIAFNEAKPVELTIEDQDEITSLINKAHASPEVLRDEIKAVIMTGAVAANIPSTELVQKAEIVANETVAKLQYLSASDVEEQIFLIHPRDVLNSISREMLIGTLSEDVADKIVWTANTQARIIGHDTGVANTLLSNFSGRLANIIYPKETGSTFKVVTEDQKESAVAVLNTSSTEKHYETLYSLTRAIERIDPNVEIDKNGMHALTRELIAEGAREEYLNRLTGNDLKAYALVGSTANVIQAVESQSRTMGFASAVVDAYYGEPSGANILNLYDTGKSLLNIGGRFFGVKTPNLGFSAIFGKQIKAKIGAAAAKGITKIIGKQAVAKAGVWAAKMGLTAVGVGTGPVGWIATALMLAKDLFSFIKRKIKEHPELLAIPVIGVGLITGLPALTVGGILGGVTLGMGGVGSVASAIGGLFSFIASAVIAAAIAPVIAFIIGAPLLVAFIAYIINTSAYMVPTRSGIHAPGEIPIDCQGNTPGTPPTASSVLSQSGFAFPVDDFSKVSYHCYHWDGEKAVDVWSSLTRPPLLAYTSGTIENVTLDDPLGGKYVILAGDDGRYYYYAHTCQIYVNQGDRVSAGDVIATMNDTGNATDQHLHFAINSTSVFYGGAGDTCPQQDFEDKFGVGVCTNPSTTCVHP